MNDDLIQIPVDVDAEKLILGCCLFNSELVPPLVGDVSADDFHIPTHKLIWRAICQLESARESIDFLTVARAIQKANQPIDLAYLSSLIDGIPRYSHASSLDSHIRLIRNASTRRRLLHFGQWLLANSTGRDLEVDDLITEANRHLESISLLKTAKNDLVSAEEAVSRTLSDLEERWSRGDNMLGLSTGFPDLDEVTGGLRGGRYYVIAAGTGMGKTTLALNFINSIMEGTKQRGQDCAGLVLSLEMTVQELTVKMIGINTRIDTWKIETGRLSHEEKRQLMIAADTLSKLSIEYVEGFSKVTPATLQSMVERVRSRHNRFDFLVVDYLQLVDSDKAIDGDHQRISEVSRELKRLSIQYNIPVIALSQLNRKSADRTNRDYQLSDLRGSGSIEQDADCVFFLQPFEWNDEQDMRRKFKIAKHRAGRRDVTVEMMFFPSHSRFAQMSDVEY